MTIFISVAAKQQQNISVLEDGHGHSLCGILKGRQTPRYSAIVGDQR